MNTLELSRLLKDANIKNRSLAKTRAQKLELCRLHNLRLDNTIELPPDVLRQVIGIIVAQGVEQVKLGGKDVIAHANALYKSLIALAATCTLVRDILSNSNPCWERILDVFCSVSDDHGREADTAQKHVLDGTISAKRALQLVTATGCESCGCKRTRKVYWPFFCRWCRVCLEAKTISDYRLVNDFKVDKSALENLPCVLADLYAPRIGSYTLQFYLINDVIDAHGGSSLEQIRDNVLDREALLKEKRQEEYARVAALITFALHEHTGGSKLPPLAQSKTYSLLANKPYYIAKQSIETDPLILQTIVNELDLYKLHNLIVRWLRELRLLLDNIDNVYHSRDVLMLAEELAAGFVPPFTKMRFVNEVWTPHILPKLLADAAKRKLLKQQEEDEREQQRVLQEKQRAARLEKQKLQNQNQNQNEIVHGTPIPAIEVAHGVYNCPICYNNTNDNYSKNRKFQSQGVVQHARDVHRVLVEVIN